MKSAPVQAAVESAALSLPVKAYAYRFWLSMLFLIVTFYCSFMSSFLVGIFVLILLDLLLCGTVLLRNAWHDVEKGRFSLSVLVCGSVLAGFGYGACKTFLNDPPAGNLSDLYTPTALLLTLYLWTCVRNARGKERTNVFIKKLDDFLPKSCLWG